MVAKLLGKFDTCKTLSLLGDGVVMTGACYGFLTYIKDSVESICEDSCIKFCSPESPLKNEITILSFCVSSHVDHQKCNLDMKSILMRWMPD